MVCNVVAGLQEVPQQEQVLTENTAVIEAWVDHVANAVQNTQQQLATQIQQMKAMMQLIQLQYVAGPQNAHQDYGVHGYHSGHAHNRSQGGHGAQRWVNLPGSHGGRVNRDLTHYFLAYGICAHPRKYCRTPAEGHKKDAVWCNKMSGSDRNCTWHVWSIPASKTNVKESKTSYTSELLCRFIVYPPQHANVVAKSDSGESKNYWHNEDIIVLTKLKDTRDGTTVQLPKNATINATNTGSIPLSVILSTHAKSYTFLMDYTVPCLSP